MTTTAPKARPGRGHGDPSSRSACDDLDVRLGGERADVAIDRRDLVAASAKKRRVPPAAGGDVEHRGTGGDQAGPLHDPGRWHPSCVSQQSHPIISGTPPMGVPTAGIPRNFMILYRLRCSKGHEFESWFKDSKTYERQEKKSLIGCAVCGEAKVARAPMAPRMGKGSKKVEVEKPAADAPAPPPAPTPEQQQMAALARHMPKELREALHQGARRGREELRACRRQVRRGSAQDPLRRERQARHLRRDQRGRGRGAGRGRHRVRPPADPAGIVARPERKAREGPSSTIADT